MAYWLLKYDCGNSIEYECHYEGNYGAKGEKRAPKRKPTSEQMEKQNRWNKKKYIRRLIKLNFDTDDYWITLRYKRGIRKGLDEIIKDFDTFRRNLKYRYKKRGKPLKYIYRVEVGSRGGIHIHILLNRLDTGETDKLVRECWTQGHPYIELLYDEGGYEQLSEYLIKSPKDDSGCKQLSLFEELEQKKLMTFNTSRNLIRPVAEKKKYSHWTMRKILRDGPKPTDGFYIDKNSIVTGVNPFTGMSYFHYIENRIDSKWDRYIETG